MARFFYTLVLLIAAPILLFGLYRSKPNKPKFGARWKEHFGCTPKLKQTGKPIWIHAVSVGESIAATPLIKALKARNPEQPIVVTTTTSTGAEQIAKLGDLVEHRYMPIDFPWTIKGFLRQIQPEKLLIIETELWPNTLAAVAKQNIPTIVVNARLSEKSCRQYQKVRPLFNDMSRHLSLVLCQHSSDKARFQTLGIPADKLGVTGSIKFDIQIADETREQAQQLRTILGQERPIWIAASTHEGEDEPILQAHQAVLASHPDALLILVPRHPERFDSVHTLTKQHGLSVERRSQRDAATPLSAQTPLSPQTQVYLGDTMGEMLVLLGAADICFMAGSLLGDKVGGHNVLEPIAMGIPTITGPSYFNFQEIVDELQRAHAITVLNHANELSQAIAHAFHHPAQPIEWQQGESPLTLTMQRIFAE